MAAIVNDRDVLLQAASVRKLTTAGVAVVPTPSSSNFYARADGSHGPDYVRISVTTILCDGPFTFAVQGAKLSNVTATTADIAYADMTSALAIVTVTAANAGTPVQGSCIVGLVSDGQSGQPGTRGAGAYYATGSAWSDSVARAACPGGVAISGDVVTISNGTTYALTKKYDGSAWVPLGGVYDGSLFVTGSIQAPAINTNGMIVRDLQGNPIVGINTPLADAYVPNTAKNSLITVNSDGSLNGAGTGKPTLPGLGLDTYRIFTKSNTATNAPGTPCGLYKNGSILYGVQRSYTLVVIYRATGAITWHKDYDVYGAGEVGGAKASDLALDLNNLADAAGQYIVIVYTFDEPRNRREESGLMQAMYRNGASRSVFGSSQFQSWSAYALVGISGCGEGNGAEAYQGAFSADPNSWIDVSFSVSGGTLMGVTLNYQPKTLQDYGYTGSMNATSDITLYVAGGMSLTGNSAVKTGGVGGNWDSSVYSLNAYVGGAFAEARMDKMCSLMFGLNSDPTVDAWYGSIDYAIFALSDGTVRAYSNGTPLYSNNPIGNYGVGDTLGVKFDGSKVSFTKNGISLWDIATTDGNPLYFDSSFQDTGASISNIRFGPMSNNSAGVAANAAINDPTNGLAQKLKANAQNILAGGAGLSAGSLTWDGNGNRTGGYGVGINKNGIVAYAANGNVTFSLDGATGNAAFAGSVTAYSGAIGGMALSNSALCSGGYTDYMWPGKDGNGNWMMGCYFGPTGILLGNANAGKYFQVTYDGEIRAPGFSLASGQLTLSSTIIINPNISGASFDTFTASMTGSAGGSFANTSGNVGYGTLTASPSGGRAPYTYQWTLTESSRTNTAYRMNVSGSTTGQSLSLVGFGSNCTNEYRVTCIVTDANGRTATIGRSVTANHGTPP